MSRTATPQDVIEGRARWCVVEGDSLAVMEGIPGGRVDAIVTDPPYSSTGDAASVMVTRGVNVTPKETQFFEAWFREQAREWRRVLSDDGAAWFTIDWRGAAIADTVSARVGFRIPTIGVWDRVYLGMGHFLRHTFETFVLMPCPAFKKTEASASEPDVWRHEWGPFLRNSGHPAEKPTALMLRALRLCSRPGGLILDPFAGSGTTGVAALLEGRRAILIERVPEYAEISRQRCEAAEQGIATRRESQLALPGLEEE